jgi:Cft2 family RNA processing exonuclease
MLGAGQEVGRSCCVLQYRGKTIVCDTGVHPAHSGMASLPFVDELDWSTVDAILITQYVSIKCGQKNSDLTVFFEVFILTTPLL